MPPQMDIGPIVKVTKIDEEWRKLPSPLAHRVLRYDDTERAFTSRLHENRQPKPAALMRGVGLTDLRCTVRPPNHNRHDWRPCVPFQWPLQG